VEIRAGTGGEEAALFARDASASFGRELFPCYLAAAEHAGATLVAVSKLVDAAQVHIASHVRQPRRRRSGLERFPAWLNRSTFPTNEKCDS